jgi:metacaspase-1
MFKSNRFSRIVTPDTRDRLLAAQANTRPIARGEAHRGAVVAIQTALAELNKGYLLGAEIDGYFGPRSSRAVESFQRDYGLIADGVVGRQVLDQLDAIYSGEVARPPHGVSLHLGLDRVDPAHYGDENALPSCVNDAKAMGELAEAAGYDALVLANEQATTANLTAFMRNAAANLYAGDCLLVSVSSHGSRIPNDSDDDEPDLYDETLCLYDRMLIDDELWALLGGLAEGVRVGLVFDSCHSGTVAKRILVDPDAQREQYVEAVKSALDTAVQDADRDDERPIVTTTEALAKALDGEQPELVAQTKALGTEGDLAELFGDLYERTVFGSSKFIDGDSGAIYEKNRELYDAVKQVVGSTESQDVLCTVTSLSACADPQTTPAGNPLSLFTYNLTHTWSRGSFPGSWTQLHRAMLDRSRPDATPQLNAYGTAGSQARLRERPFTF